MESRIVRSRDVTFAEESEKMHAPGNTGPSEELDGLELPINDVQIPKNPSVDSSIYLVPAGSSFDTNAEELDDASPLQHPTPLPGGVVVLGNHWGIGEKAILPMVQYFPSTP